MVYCTDLIFSSPLHFPLLFCPAPLYPLHPCHVLLLLSLLPFLVPLLRHQFLFIPLHFFSLPARHSLCLKTWCIIAVTYMWNKSLKKFRLYGIRNHDLRVACTAAAADWAINPTGELVAFWVCSTLVNYDDSLSLYCLNFCRVQFLFLKRQLFSWVVQRGTHLAWFLWRRKYSFS